MKFHYATESNGFVSGFLRNATKSSGSMRPGGCGRNGMHNSAEGADRGDAGIAERCTRSSAGAPPANGPARRSAHLGAPACATFTDVGVGEWYATFNP